MKVGLYFGSFNPIHHGHLLIANYILQHVKLDQIWFVISPQNPLKRSSTLLNEYHRLHLVRLAVEGEKGLKASDIEFKLPKPSYTVDTLAYLQEKYPTDEFSIIMGSDISRLSRGQGNPDPGCTLITHFLDGNPPNDKNREIRPVSAAGIGARRDRKKRLLS